MGVTVEEVARLAALARIDLTDDEREMLAPQLDVILAAVARVSELATVDIPPSSHPMTLENVFRADVVTESLAVSDVLANAPATEEDRFRVPRILTEEA